MADKDPDFVDEVGEMIEYFMRTRKVADGDATALAVAVKNAIREQYRGERVRIRVGQRRCEYAAQIKSEFDGTNMSEITERYGVSRATVYRIIGE
tara:strand:+ start:262 stop:546 length:285 start_codon:yes stop_codon:yes gene_type:complete